MTFNAIWAALETAKLCGSLSHSFTSSTNLSNVFLPSGASDSIVSAFIAYNLVSVAVALTSRNKDGIALAFKAAYFPELILLQN